MRYSLLQTAALFSYSEKIKINVKEVRQAPPQENRHGISGRIYYAGEAIKINNRKDGYYD